MKFRFVNAKLNKPEDITMDTLGELPAYVWRYYYDRYNDYGYDIYKHSMQGNKINKSELKAYLTKLIEDGTTSLDKLRDHFRDYLKTKGNKYDVDTVFAKLKNSRKLPNIKVKNVWQYMMGKIGNTSAYFTTLKEATREEPDTKFTTNIGGYEVYYKESKPKAVKDLPTWMAFVYGDFMDGDQYKVMPANEIVNYLSDTDDQVFDLYKI